MLFVVRRSLLLYPTSSDFLAVDLSHHLSALASFCASVILYLKASASAAGPLKFEIGGFEDLQI